MQNSVLIAIFTALLTKRGITRDYLSKKFELSPRTITRYIDVLAESGIPITSKTGSGGGYFLADEYKIDRMLFTNKDVKRIISSLQDTAPLYTDELNGKIISTLKEVYKEYNDKLSFELDSDMLIDSVPSNHDPSINDNFNKIISAVRRGRKLSVVFNKENPLLNTTTYSSIEIDPYHIVYSKKVWYFYGYCQTNGKYNLYPFEDIENMFVTPRLFSRRHDSNIYAFLMPSLDLNDNTTMEFDYSCTIKDNTPIQQPTGLRPKYDTNVVAKILSFGYSEKVNTPTEFKKDIMLESRKMLENF